MQIIYLLNTLHNVHNTYLDVHTVQFMYVDDISIGHTAQLCNTYSDVPTLYCMNVDVISIRTLQNVQNTYLDVHSVHRWITYPLDTLHNIHNTYLDVHTLYSMYINVISIGQSAKC